jgi:hypothetical protein
MAGKPPDEDGWIHLDASDDFAVWRKPIGEWKTAESVALDPENPKRLTFKEGKTILVNDPTKGATKNLITVEEFGDVEVHVEFFLPKGSNSGVKFNSVYEIQLCDSFGKKELTGADCGGIYPRAELKPKYHHLDKGIPPKVNACKEPGEWQVLDALFLVPRFDDEGKKTKNARLVKAVLNCQVIHENQELETPTGNNHSAAEKPKGPLLFQADHGPVAFRNLKARPIKAVK